MNPLPRALSLGMLLIGVSGSVAAAQETLEPPGFEEHSVEFRNQAVTLAGTLLLPRTELSVPATVFVHGAGRQTREPYREVAEYFASQGIAALIYDKRGVGQSSGAYESHEPYENLVNDALAAIDFLKQRREVNGSRIGIWGLSQGAYISATAASRSEDVQFVVAAGASVADGALYFYRDNLFLRYGLSDRLRDVAEKAQLVQDSLPYNLRDETLLASFRPRAYPSPDQYVHPGWSRVRQPVLAMWGQLDQNQPVAESVEGLKNSLAQANNRKWTMIILPRASHGLGVSETGELHRGWNGYAPGALKTMTDWVHQAVVDPERLDTMKLVGSAQPTGVLSKLKRYESLRWYGNGTMQTALWLLFLAGFVASSAAAVRSGWARLLRRPRNEVSPAFQRILNFKRTIGILNLLILLALGVLTLSVFDPIHPVCPPVLTYLPLLGTISTLATGALLIRLATIPRVHTWTAAPTVRSSLDLLCFVLFIPYLYYWNVIGLRF